MKIAAVPGSRSAQRLRFAEEGLRSQCSAGNQGQAPERNHSALRSGNISVTF